MMLCIITWKSCAGFLLRVDLKKNPSLGDKAWSFFLRYKGTKRRNSSWHALWHASPSTILTWLWYWCVLPTKTRGCDKPPFVQWLLWSRAHRQWRFSWMSHIVTLDCTAGHSQIRSCVLCAQLAALKRCESAFLSADSESFPGMV